VSFSLLLLSVFGRSEIQLRSTRRFQVLACGFRTYLLNAFLTKFGVRQRRPLWRSRSANALSLIISYTGRELVDYAKKNAVEPACRIVDADVGSEHDDR
jgi:hypothetical protein